MVLAEPLLVGREKELGELQRCLDMAIKGKGTTVFVSGEAGAGKTRLVCEFLSKAKKKAITVLSGWCLSDAAVPYLPFAEAFRTHFSVSAEEEEPIEDQMAGALQPRAKLRSANIEEYGITAWLSRLSYLTKPGKVDAISPQVWKDQLFTAVAETLHSMSAERPVVLQIEDAHWADSASLALLHYVARAINNTERILILATFRSEELTTDTEGRPNQLAEMIRLMKREEILTEIKIQNLTHTDVRKLAENMMGGSLQAEFAEKLAKESHGNPLFLVESLRMLVENKSLVAQDNEWRLAADGLGIPYKVRDVILRRLANLKYGQRRILDAASVIGEEFNAELLSTVLGQDSLDVLETLNTIAQSTSIVCDKAAFYRFDHARSREVLYEALSPPLKRGYHARIAERLETPSKSGTLPLADLAHHYAQAQNEEKAIKYSLAAGNEELARWSNTEAAKHFQYVLEKIGESQERINERVIALEGLGDAYYASDKFSQAAGVFDQLASLQSGAPKLRALRKAMFAAYYLGDMPLLAKLTQKAEENATADRLEAARVLHQKARISVMARDDIATCRRLSEEALKIFEEEYALSDAAWILFTIGAISADEQYQNAVAASLRSVALYDELGDILSQMEAYLYTGMTFHGFGLIEEGMQRYEKVIELNEQLRLGDYIRLIGAYAFLSLGLMRVDIPASISKALKALEYAEKTDSSLYLGLIYEFLTVEYAFAEDSVHMEEYFEKLMSQPEKVLSTTFSGHFLKPTMGVYYAAQNEFEKSNQYFSEYFQIMTLLSPRFHATARQAYAWALSRQGRIDEAKVQRVQIEKTLQIARERFRHVNVQTSLMTCVHPEVDQIFEARLDLVNVSKSTGSVVKIENLIVTDFVVMDISPNCFVNDETVEFKDKTIGPFEVKTAKLALKAAKPGVIQLNPMATYVDDLGETKTSIVRTFTIKVQPAKPKFEVLPGRVSTGVADVDALLYGGIPEHYAVVLTSPSNDESEKLIQGFLEAGVEGGETVFHVATDVLNTKTLLEKYPSSFLLILCNLQADTMIQNAPNICKLKGVENLTDIDIALAKAFRTLNSAHDPKRICIDIFSDVLLQHQAVTTRRWLSALLPKLKSRGFTVLAMVNPRMHPQEDLESVLGLFDGEIDIYEKETPKGRANFLKIKKMTGQKYLKGEIPLTEA